MAFFLHGIMRRSCRAENAFEKSALLDGKRRGGTNAVRWEKGAEREDSHKLLYENLV
jgi:hypothetical protein